MTYVLDGKEITKAAFDKLSGQDRYRAKQKLADGRLIRAVPPAGTDWSEPIKPNGMMDIAEVLDLEDNSPRPVIEFDKDGKLIGRRNFD